MSEPPDSEAPRLAPPGAGVPAYQRWAGKYLFLPFWRATLPPARVPDLMEKQGAELIGLGDGLPAPLLTRRVLVPPQIGLEDSSRFHSWAMVLEHLTIVGNDIVLILGDLTRGNVPPGVVRVENLKPRGRIDAPTAVEEYRTMLLRVRQIVLNPHSDWRSRARYVHPWFGPLGAKQWACFAPFHQAIHLKQARTIRRLLDRI